MTDLFSRVSDFVVQCQGFEGGIGGFPGVEAHGGYAYCGLATLMLLDAAHDLNLSQLLDWAVHRQMADEGGFQGRTNKLVDGCYSFWMGALFPILESVLETGSLFDRVALQEYLLRYCQGPDGGLRDKPNK